MLWVKIKYIHHRNSLSPKHFFSSGYASTFTVCVCVCVIATYAFPSTLSILSMLCCYKLHAFDFSIIFHSSFFCSFTGYFSLWGFCGSWHSADMTGDNYSTNILLVTMDNLKNAHWNSLHIDSILAKVLKQVVCERKMRQELSTQKFMSFSWSRQNKGLEEKGTNPENQKSAIMNRCNGCDLDRSVEKKKAKNSKSTARSTNRLNVREKNAQYEKDKRVRESTVDWNVVHSESSTGSYG